jgi:aerobic carbon-monoxide dehydrogenase small subunit
VMVDGELRLSCLTLASSCEGARIETVSGMADGPNLHPLQIAFMEHFAAQCGFCTPGMLTAAKALLAKNPNPTRDDVIDGIAGNICRCTGYEPIIEAILAAAKGASGVRAM